MGDESGEIGLAACCQIDNIIVYQGNVRWTPKVEI